MRQRWSETLKGWTLPWLFRTFRPGKTSYECPVCGYHGPFKDKRLTRRPDLRQAEASSLYDDIRIWLNAENANPADDLRSILEELGCAKTRIGVELHECLVG